MLKLKRLLAAINPRRFHLKWVLHAIWICALGSLFIYLNTAPPFLAVASDSMEPLISRGDVILSDSAVESQIKVGDVIVFKVAPFFQEKYGYPPTICHRVVRIQNSLEGLSFRTKGDHNSGEDPFMTPAQNLIGLERTSIPKLGYAVMFAQSVQGKYFLGGLIILFLLYANSTWVWQTLKSMRSSVSGVSTTEFVKSQNDIENKIGGMTDQVVKSMNGFSSAMSEYAQHIASHTGAIKSLAEAAQHMESILSKQDALLSRQPSLQLVSAEPDSVQLSVGPQEAIEVTPELKLAVKEFIFKYNLEHNLNSLEVTPELRSAVWDFIQEFVKNPPLPEAGSYCSAIKTVKITPDMGEIEEAPDQELDSNVWSEPHSGHSNNHI
jgi:signal peptidase I